jgi:hypothetical protein
MEYQSPLELFERVGNFIREETIPTGRKALLQYLANSDVIRLDLSLERKNIAYLLNTRRMASKQPKSTYVTDLDREVEIKGATALLQADFEFITELSIIIAERLETARLWLSV